MANIKVAAPAKVNLFLGVGDKREDGYHEALSIMHALALHDVINVVSVPADSFDPAFQVGDAYDLPTVERNGIHVGIEVKWHEGLTEQEIDLSDNLITKAVFTLAEKASVDWKGYLRFEVKKHIPAQAGLGGGSTDAAATLIACCHLWDIPVTSDQVTESARSLGADVPFFLHGGCVRLNGAGDELDAALTPRYDAIALVRAGKGVRTTDAYRVFDEGDHPLDEHLCGIARSAVAADKVPLYNNLAHASETILPELVEIANLMRATPGVRAVLLSGSGDATYAICESHDVAMKVVEDASIKGWWARSTAFSSLKAAVIPKRS